MTSFADAGSGTRKQSLRGRALGGLKRTLAKHSTRLMRVASFSELGEVHRHTASHSAFSSTSTYLECIGEL